jgi:hypothetical protein
MKDLKEGFPPNVNGGFSGSFKVGSPMLTSEALTGNGALNSCFRELIELPNWMALGP